MDMAQMAASWSKDPSTKVGAVLVDEQKRVLGIGFNGFPRRVKDSIQRYADRDTKYEFIVHAEMNAVLNATMGVKGSALFTWPIAPCSTCMGMLIQAGIKKVYYPIHDPKSVLGQTQARWDMTVTKTMCDEAGVLIQGGTA
jgi:dCMP deaminase